MVIGYRFFLRRIATMMDSKEKLTVRTIADRLSLRHDEFRDLLNIMITKGDIECITENMGGCSGSCPGCSKTCNPRTSGPSSLTVRSYRLTQKGRKNCGETS
ncbi:MAG: FeoC-like transcriptional regulator [Methanolobus sp.]|nr:FeoC-like transcriptional regulator [Methanolobus sp.]